MLWLLPAIVLGQGQELVAAGEIEFQRLCATCHGAEGKGNGVTAQYLTVKPADLTQLGKKNQGQFPGLAFAISNGNR